ncbi:hypothetical protein BDZ91DRAFT_844644 [Kalaharituber pfeilii]|nr:hypothetical protein BDZ91DRAFT_844644 [Kalaharituber pfeilii]
MISVKPIQDSQETKIPGIEGDIPSQQTSGDDGDLPNEDDNEQNDDNDEPNEEDIQEDGDEEYDSQLPVTNRDEHNENIEAQRFSNYFRLEEYEAQGHMTGLNTHNTDVTKLYMNNTAIDIVQLSRASKQYMPSAKFSNAQKSHSPKSMDLFGNEQLNQLWVSRSWTSSSNLAIALRAVCEY